MNTERTAILGALLGDALGVPHEFKDSADIPVAGQIHMRMPASYAKTYAHIPYGTWSDDGSQLLCLREALSTDDFDLTQFAEFLLAWRYGGYNQAGGVVFDCGLQTEAALERRRNGTPAHLCGGTDVRSNGNGALMRVLPAAFLADEEQAYRVAIEQGLITHGHALSKACCAVYVGIVRGLVAGVDLPGAIRRSFERVAEVEPGLDEPLRAIWAHGETRLPTGTGYVVDTLWSALWALQQGRDYVGVVRAAVSLGRDTDTTACVAGGLAAVMYGLDSVPDEWWSEMRGLELVK